jgi:hypothetical protein
MRKVSLMPGRIGERLGSCQVKRRKVMLMPGRNEKGYAHAR